MYDRGVVTPALPSAATWQRLQTFLAVYDAGSVRGAAEALHVTPPAVSAAVTALESALGTALFTKTGRGIAPTEAARTFAGYARQMLGLLDEAAGAVRDAERGRLRIGAVATASEYVLPRLMASFVAEHPRVDLSLAVLPRDELFHLALDHGVDLVVAGRPPSGSRLVTRAHRANRLVLVGRPGRDLDPLATTWLLTAAGSGTRDAALSLLARHQASPPLLTLGTFGAAVAAAREGLGVTLVHEEAVRDQLDAGLLQAYPLAGTPLERPWHLCTAAEPTTATWLFVHHVVDAARDPGTAFHTGPPLEG